MRRSGGTASWRYLGAAALTVVAGAVLVPATVASAAGGCVSLGSAANYSEYVTGPATVSSENVAGSAAYGGASTISQSNLATTTVPASNITLVLGSPNIMNTTTLDHGKGVYVAPLAGGAIQGRSMLSSSRRSHSSLGSAVFTRLGLDDHRLPQHHRLGDGVHDSQPDLCGNRNRRALLSESQLHSAFSIAISAPSSAVVVINVTGTGALSLSAQTVTLSGGVTAPDVLRIPFRSLIEPVGGELVRHAAPAIRDFTMSSDNVTGSILAGTTSASLSTDNVNLGLFAGCIASGPPPELPRRCSASSSRWRRRGWWAVVSGSDGAGA